MGKITTPDMDIIEALEANKNPSTAKDVILARVMKLKTVEFVVDIFIDFVRENNDWKTIIEPLREKFQAHLKNVAPDTDHTSMGVIMKYGISFLASHPMFEMHEYAEQGAPMTPKEKKHFVFEIKDNMNNPLKRRELFPYIAAVGDAIVTATLANEEVRKKVELRKAQMTEVLAGAMIMSALEEYQEPFMKGLRMMDRLTEVGIEIDQNGEVTDKEGFLKRDKELHEAYGRTKGTGSPGEESPGNIPPAPEGLN